MSCPRGRKAAELEKFVPEFPEMIIYPGEYDSYPDFDIIKIPGFRKGHGPRQIRRKGDILWHN